LFSSSTTKLDFLRSFSLPFWTSAERGEENLMSLWNDRQAAWVALTGAIAKE
jgi:hypothetical protein